MNSSPEYQKATQATIEDLETVAKSLASRRLTKLTLPEIEAVADLVGKVIPAGNVPGMILSGLTSISGNHVQPQKARQDINILFREVSLFFEQAKYGTMFAGPAAIIWGYQNLLKLAGKDSESAFPEGVWQFYVDYALREDTARHANETKGFDAILDQNDIQLNEVDRLTAWVMTAITSLHQYPQLLANEWHERTSLWLLQELIEGTDLFAEWDKQKPYARDADGASYTYPEYRKIKFEEYLNNRVDSLPPKTRKDLDVNLKEAAERSLAAYQKQLNILAYLEPNSFGETRTAIPLERACVGIIHQGNYFLLPVCEPGTTNPLDVRTARSQIARLVSSPPAQSAGLKMFALLKRSEFAVFRGKVNVAAQESLEKLHHAPILINWDHQAESKALLSDIRQGERGVGAHPLTIFDTGKTFVFDQSHIFFDGAWGAALSEIMTNEALSWAGYLNLLSPAVSAGTQIYRSLEFPLHPSEIQLIQKAGTVSAEAGAENKKINIQACLELKHYFKQRSDLLKLTVNDLLVLYRAIHAVTYRPSERIQQEVDDLAKVNPKVADQVKKALESFARTTPSILIPIDASKRVPRDRIYPMNLEVPLNELGLLKLHGETIRILAEYRTVKNPGREQFERFDVLQKRYLATLGGFGTILAKAKDIAVRGESASVGAIKLLAHLPAVVKQMLDKIPTRYEKLNNLLKGTEVLSNLGAVARSSSITRFITAKDDNEQKQLTWGVVTDAEAVMTITLRDFRPHVVALQAAGQQDLANLIAQDFLDAYVQGFNQFIHEVTQIAVARPLDSHRRD